MNRELKRTDLPKTRTSGKSLHLPVTTKKGVKKYVCDIHFGDETLCYLEGAKGKPTKISSLLIEDKTNVASKPDVTLCDVCGSENTTSNLISDIQDKRNKVITERLKEIVGIDLNIEEEAKRRFKRLAIEYNGNEETIYFNDGSIEGKRIVTFVRDEKPLNFEVDRCEIRVGYSYY